MFNPSRTRVDTSRSHKSYKQCRGCHNCGYVFIYYDYDAATKYYCAFKAPPRPKCMSMAMRSYEEYVDMDTEGEEAWYAAYDAWDEWRKGREVHPWGKCDHHQSAFWVSVDGASREFASLPESLQKAAKAQVYPDWAKTHQNITEEGQDMTRETCRCVFCGSTDRPMRTSGYGDCCIRSYKKLGLIAFLNRLLDYEKEILNKGVYGDLETLQKVRGLVYLAGYDIGVSIEDLVTKESRDDETVGDDKGTAESAG